MISIIAARNTAAITPQTSDNVRASASRPRNSVVRSLPLEGEGWGVGSAERPARQRGGDCAAAGLYVPAGRVLPAKLRVAELTLSAATAALQRRFHRAAVCGQIPFSRACG